MRTLASVLLVTVGSIGCAGGVTIDPIPSPRTTTIPAGSQTGSSQGRSTAATLGIPPGHLPSPGQCRIWTPGRPPGHQGESGPCGVLESRVRPGEWLVYRPTEDKKLVEVRVYDSNRPTIRLIRFFEVATGRLLREETRGSG